jgi:hypothetical protein
MRGAGLRQGGIDRGVSSGADFRKRQFALDGFPILPIIGRNTNTQMNILLSLSLIVILIVVLITKDQFSVRMALVRVK